MSESDRVLIVGGGIGGLAAAIALRRVGIDVAVFERLADAREIGAGLQVWVNGVKALHAMGAAAGVEAVGGPVESYQFRSWRGQVLVNIPVGEMARQHSAPHPLIMRRPELHSALLDAVGQGVVQHGVRCESLEQDDEGVTVRLADGREERGSVLIGADGIESGIRTQLFGQIKPRYGGYQYLRALLTDFTPEGFPVGNIWMNYGPGSRFGMANGGPGRVFWFGVLKRTPGSGDLPIGRKAEIMQHFRQFAQPVPALIEATPEETIGRTDIRDLAPMTTWGRGRVTLLGDAVHAATPNLGRGASEALEDGVALARHLASTNGLQNTNAVTSALRSYESERMGPTARVTTMGWRVGVIAGWENPVACTARDLVMRTVFQTVLGRVMVPDFARPIEPLPASAPVPSG